MSTEKPRKVSFLGENSQNKKWKKILNQRWFFPVLYMLAAALIISSAWWYQQSKVKDVAKPLPKGQDTILQNETPTEKTASQDMIYPISPQSEAEKTLSFYDESSSPEQREAAMVKYQNSYRPHAGVDFSRKDGKTFDVLAALDGEVIRVEKNPMVGTQIEIQHDNGLITVYQSIEDVQVKKGQKVKQGEVIARAGQNQFEKEAGKHLHFEVRKGKQTVNPETYLKKQMN
jgi:stage II sporulation protein Q